MTPKLLEQLQKLASMKYPSVSEILRKRGFRYEAQAIDDLIAAFEESNGKR